MRLKLKDTLYIQKQDSLNDFDWWISYWKVLVILFGIFLIGFILGILI